MPNSESYRTVLRKAEAIFIEKKSKFIAAAAPVADEPSALAFLSEIRKKYPDANHHVYAYIIKENNICRYSDDGEPSGTAGIPVLDILKHRSLTDVIVVVTRYFGGTLLGTGGLVRAYSETAVRGIDAAGETIRKKCDVLALTVAYTLVGKLQHEIAARGIKTGETNFGDNVTFTLYSPVGETAALIADITDITLGSAEIQKIKQTYIDFGIQPD